MRQARYAVDAGVDVLQIRERDLEAGELARLCADKQAIAQGRRTRIIVNERVDVALACGAHGVHLRGDSMPAAAVRNLVPPGFLIGRSVHSVEEAVAVANAADYLIAGTVWETSSKRGLADSNLLGPEGLSRIVQAVRVPVLAIGGISVDRFAEVRRSGAAGVAAIGLFMAQQAAEWPSCRAVPLIETVRLAGRQIDTPKGAS
jgi:thiamine-phosphate pyrophosphorylase